MTAKPQEISTQTVEVSTDAVLSVIERAAANPDVDIEKMERLLAMKERMDAQDAEKAFNAAMSAVQSELPKVRKDAHNSQTNSNYATYEALSKALTPVITRHGFSCSFGTDASPLGPEMVRITVRTSHVAGHTINSFCDLPIDMTGIKGNVNKTKTHGTGSTYMYGRRYLKLMVFDLAVTDEDDDGQTAEPPHKFIAMVQAEERNKESMQVVRDALDRNEYSTAYEAWAEIPDDDKKAMWVAPTKAAAAGFEAPLTTKHIAQFKTNEWSQARQLASGGEENE